MKRWHAPNQGSRERCQRFARMSPDLSGHGCQSERAPMLVGTSLPVTLSAYRALGPPLWIRTYVEAGR